MKISRRFRPIIVKELRQIRRDKRVLFILTVIPAILLLLNGYALNFDVRNIALGVIDQEKSKESRELISEFVSSGYFNVVSYMPTVNAATEMIDEASLRAAIVIPPDFSEKISSHRPVDIQVLVDGMDANAASTVVGYVQAVSLHYSQNIILQNLAKMGRKSYIPINYDARIWYNPELKSSKFLVPGLIAFIVMITSVIATTLSIVREMERNTIEQINVSPVRPYEIIISKMIPYAVISLIAAFLVLVAAYFLFGVVIRGSYLDLFLTTLLFILSTLSIGLLVSTISDSQQVAFQISALVSMLPTLIFSGFIFPIRSMPFWLQILTNVTPAKFYLVILRSIILKGVGFEAFWDQVVYLLMFTTIVLAISIRRFRKVVG